MALSDLTFKLYTDAGLTTLFSGLYQLNHATDLSDNPQDFQLWFGSNAVGTQLQATSGPGVDDIVLTPTDTLPDWQASHAYIVGDVVEPTAPNGKIYRVGVAGTSAGTEPTWPVGGIGSTVINGGVTFVLLGNRHEVNELTLALSAPDLATNIPGAALNLGPTILSGVANAVHLFLRVNNAVTNVRNNAGHPEFGVFINEVIETAVP